MDGQPSSCGEGQPVPWSAANMEANQRGASWWGHLKTPAAEHCAAGSPPKATKCLWRCWVGGSAMEDDGWTLWGAVGDIGRSIGRSISHGDSPPTPREGGGTYMSNGHRTCTTSGGWRQPGPVALIFSKTHPRLRPKAIALEQKKDTFSFCGNKKWQKNVNFLGTKNENENGSQL